MKIPLIALTLLVLTGATARAQHWNTTPGPVTYVGSRTGTYTTDVSVVEGPEQGYLWHFFEQGPYGYVEENFHVSLDAAGNAYLESVSCGTDAGGFDEGWVNDYGYFGAHLIAPAEPEPGMTWQWPSSDMFWTGAPVFTVSGRETVQIGRKPIMAWRIDVESGLPPGDAVCNGRTMPPNVETYWIAESLGIVKWVFSPLHEVVMDDAPNVVRAGASTWTTLKTTFHPAN